MNAEERAQLGQAWLVMGLTEHASVAAFARFVLHLLGLGAPPHLLSDAARAMNDEIEHARLCFGIARRFTAQAAGPGPLSLDNVLEGGDDPVSILKAAIVEGCFEETISAHCAAAALERTIDDVIREALTRIVDDEMRHAELSWQFVTWMLDRYPQYRADAEQCFAETLAARGETFAPTGPAVLETHGHLLADSVNAVRKTTIEREIRPRIALLFARSALIRAR